MPQKALHLGKAQQNTVKTVEVGKTQGGVGKKTLCFVSERLKYCEQYPKSSQRWQEF